MSTVNATKLAQDAVTITVTAITAISTSQPEAALAALPQIKDILEQMLLELPPLDATALDPGDRAAADAAALAAAAKP